MSYEEFKAKYEQAFQRMMSYSCDQAGSVIYAEEMAALEDDYPEWAARVEAETQPSEMKFWEPVY